MRLIDWQNAPQGTMTNHGEVLCMAWHPSPNKPDKLYGMVFDDSVVRELPISKLRVVLQPRWTYHEGGSCPLPEWLTFGFITRAGFEFTQETSRAKWEESGSRNDIIAYRITGIDRAGGWTDDPSEVTRPVEIIQGSGVATKWNEVPA